MKVNLDNFFKDTNHEFNKIMYWIDQVNTITQKKWSEAFLIKFFKYY